MKCIKLKGDYVEKTKNILFHSKNHGPIPQFSFIGFIHLFSLFVSLKKYMFTLPLFSGSICLLCGVIITTIEIINPHHFSTILEVNYDTPYDRHVIIEDSRGKRNQKKRSINENTLEDPDKKGLGSRILR